MQVAHLRERALECRINIPDRKAGDRASPLVSIREIMKRHFPDPVTAALQRLSSSLLPFIHLVQSIVM